MSDLEELRAALVAEEEFAPTAEKVAAEVKSRVRLRQRRTRRTSLLAVAASVAAVVAATALVVRAAHPASVTPGPTTEATSSMATIAVPSSLPSSSVPSPQTTASPSPAPTDVAALANGTWSTLPIAPIDGRTRAVGVWTGTEMIIWGGQVGSTGPQGAGRTFADGAAYDPSTRAWRVLPVSPLTARYDAKSVWTGQYLFIWGGLTRTIDSAGRAIGTARTDGAVYDPAANTWQLVPAAGLTEFDPAKVALVWTGQAVMLLSAADVTRAPHAPINVRSYDPRSNQWTARPDLTVPSDITHRHVVGEITAAMVGPQLAVWVNWWYSMDIGFGINSSGVLVFTADPAVGDWHLENWYPPSQMPLAAPIWTGQNMVLSVTGPWCPGNTLCQRPTLREALSVDLIHHQVSTQQVPTASQFFPSFNVRTGTGLVAFEAGGQHRVVSFDPTVPTFRTLPNLPGTIGDPVAVWTGNALLTWGEGKKASTAAGFELQPD